MPLYEYECVKCFFRFEELQKMGEGGENLNCPECGEKGPRKLLSGFVSKSCSPASGFS